MADYAFLEPASMRSTDSLPVRRTTPELIDLDLVQKHITGARTRGRYQGAGDVMDYLFRSHCLVEVGTDIYATLTGLLCFGRDPQVLFPQAVVDLGHYRGTEPLSFEVIHLEKNIGGTIFQQLDRVESYLRANIHRGMTLAEGTLQRVEVPEYPQPVIRELIVNMLAHRDYANYMATARVQFLRNRIDWISPGGLPPGITVDNLLSAQQSRNPHLLRILYEAGYMEAFGQGLDTVVAVLDVEQMSPPKFEDTGANFIVTVYGRALDMYAPSSVYGKLNDSQRKILELLRAVGRTTPADIAQAMPSRSERSRQRDLEGLIEAGLVQTSGAGRTLRYLLVDGTS